MIGRRPLLLAAAAASVAAMPGSARSAIAPKRWIWAQNHAGEEVAAAYRTGNDYNVAALVRLRHLFRDLREGTEGPLPPLLIDLLSVLQERWGYRHPLVLGSGFRTQRTNAALEGAAPASFHLRGLAADITLRGIPPGDLGLTWRIAGQGRIITSSVVLLLLWIRGPSPISTRGVPSAASPHIRSLLRAAAP